MTPIRDEQLDALRRAFARGDTWHSAARQAGVSASTAGNYFRRFAAADAARGPVSRKRPIYTGPAWIG